MRLSLPLSKIYEAVLDSIFPAYCIGCNSKESILCDSCVASLPPSTENKLLGKNIYAVFDYKNALVKDAVWKLKYSGTKMLAKIFAGAIHEKLYEELGDLALFENFKNPVLVPIPLSKKRLRERGFNQAELIAKELSACAGSGTLPVVSHALLKIVDTQSQASIKNRGARLKNVVGCFSVSDSSPVRGKNIILIDDVSTTGATINEARKMLREAGAKKVIAFVVAH